MKILLSAYACAPNFGSEPAAGWNFAEQLAFQNHEVTVITNDVSRKDIERYNGEIPANITFIYHRLPLWAKAFLYRPTGPLAHIYYFFWQVSSVIYLRKYLKDNQVDLIHLVTLGVFRTPVFLGLLGKPFVLGPVGGGEFSTAQLQQNLPLNSKVKEKLRHWVNLTALVNPFMYITYYTTDLLLLKTRDNLRYIPDKFHSKCRISLEVGIAREFIPKRENASPKIGTVKILFAGRLEYWKGAHLAIKAYAQIAEIHGNASFTIVGSGPEETWFRDIASEHNVLEKINWISRVNQEKLFQMYEEYDIFLFPSMHDSSGYVAVEAISFGLAVVCLDLGGPKEIVNKECACIIPTSGFSEQQVVEKLGKALRMLVTHPNKLNQFKRKALKRAEAFTWEKVVKRNYTIIQQNLSLEQEKIHLEYATEF